MKVSLIFDFLCPFCYKQHLVLNALEGVEIEPLPRFLKAEVPIAGLEMDPETKIKMNKTLDDLKKEGVFQGVHLAPRSHFYNSYRAHQMAQSAYKLGAYLPFALKVYEAYFSGQKNIADPDLLDDLARSVGLDPDQMHDLFDVDLLREKLWTSFSLFTDKGLKTIPVMVIHPEERIIDHSTSLAEMKEILKEYE